MKSKYNPPKRFILNDRQLCDLEMLLNGGFSPLKGFMCEKDYKSVVEHSRLSNNENDVEVQSQSQSQGEIWPLPIILAVNRSLFVPDDQIILVKDVNETIELVHSYDSTKVLARLHVEDIYKPDLEWECLNTLGTIDRNHPYADYVLGSPDVFYVGGSIESVSGI